MEKDWSNKKDNWLQSFEQDLGCIKQWFSNLFIEKKKSEEEGIEDLFQTAGTMDILTAYKSVHFSF